MSLLHFWSTVENITVWAHANRDPNKQDIGFIFAWSDSELWTLVKYSRSKLKIKNYGGPCPFQGLSSGTTLMQIQSGRTVPLMPCNASTCPPYFLFPSIWHFSISPVRWWCLLMFDSAPCLHLLNGLTYPRSACLSAIRPKHSTLYLSTCFGPAC